MRSPGFPYSPNAMRASPLQAAVVSGQMDSDFGYKVFVVTTILFRYKSFNSVGPCAKGQSPGDLGVFRGRSKMKIHDL